MGSLCVTTVSRFLSAYTHKYGCPVDELRIGGGFLYIFGLHCYLGRYSRSPENKRRISEEFLANELICDGLGVCSSLNIEFYFGKQRRKNDLSIWCQWMQERDLLCLSTL